MFRSLGPSRPLFPTASNKYIFSEQRQGCSVKTGHECLKYFVVFSIFIAVVLMFRYFCHFLPIFSPLKNSLSVSCPPFKVLGSSGNWAVHVKKAAFLNFPIPVDVCIPHPELPLGTCSRYILFSLTLLSCLRLFGVCSDDIFKMQ